MKTLFETYKDYFRLGAAVSGIILMNDEERLKQMAICAMVSSNRFSINTIASQWYRLFNQLG